MSLRLFKLSVTWENGSGFYRTVIKLEDGFTKNSKISTGATIKYRLHFPSLIDEADLSREWEAGHNFGRKKNWIPLTPAFEGYVQYLVVSQ